MIRPAASGLPRLRAGSFISPSRMMVTTWAARNDRVCNERLPAPRGLRPRLLLNPLRIEGLSLRSDRVRLLPLEQPKEERPNELSKIRQGSAPGIELCPRAGVPLRLHAELLQRESRWIR